MMWPHAISFFGNRRRARTTPPRRRREPQIDRLEGRCQPNGLAGPGLTGELATDLLSFSSANDQNLPAGGTFLSGRRKNTDQGRDHVNPMASSSRNPGVVVISTGPARPSGQARTVPKPATVAKAPSGPIGILATSSSVPSAATTIGPAGTVTTTIGASSATARAVIIEPLNGQNMVVAAGVELPSGTNVQHSALARYNPDGSLDPSFGNGGIVTTNFSGNYYPGDSIESAAVQSNEQIVVAGTAALKPTTSTHQDYLLARYNTNGTLDTSFNKTGYVIAPFTATKGGDWGDIASGVALQTINGTTRIVVAGMAQATSTGSHEFALARYNLDGSLDTTFGSGGKVLTLYANQYNQNGEAMALQPDGKIIVAGQVYGLSSSGPEVVVARYLPDGSLDSSFGNGGEAVYANPNFVSSKGQLGIAIQSNGQIVVGGTNWNAAVGNDYIAAVRLNSDGSPDAGFGNDGLVVESLPGYATAVAIQPSTGQIDLGGYDPYMSPGSFVVYQLNSSDGSLDPNFGNGGVAVTLFPSDARANAMTLQPDGSIVQAGTTSGDFALARYTTAGQLDTTF